MTKSSLVFGVSYLETHTGSGKDEFECSPGMTLDHCGLNPQIVFKLGITANITHTSRQLVVGEY